MMTKLNLNQSANIIAGDAGARAYKQMIKCSEGKMRSCRRALRIAMRNMK